MSKSPLTALTLLAALVLALGLVACGGEEAPEADGGEDVRHSDPASTEAARQTTLALIQAFQSGDQARAEELFAQEGRWQTERGFQQWAQMFQNTLFDLDTLRVRPHGDSHEVLVEGDVSAESPASRGVRTFAFFTGNFDGVTKVGGIEMRRDG